MSQHLYCIHDKIYNLADFVEKHPGGSNAFDNLHRGGINDITPLVYSYHKDPAIIFEVLSKYEVPNDKGNAVAIQYLTNYKYDKYVELKTLVYNEIREKGLPLYWSTVEFARNIGGFAIYVWIWIHCANLVAASAWWFVLLSFINVGHCALVFHETSHHVGFRNQRVNAVVSHIAVAPILTTEEWKWDHNYLHHCFTNTKFDADYNGHLQTFRHSSNHPYYWQHQFQHIYAFVLFCLGGFSGQFDSIKHKRWNFLLFASILYWFGIYNTLVFYFLTGFLFLAIAQLSHIQPECVAGPSNDFLINQVTSSMNYKTENPIVRFLCFGLDIQIEHHLFPNIPHSTLRQVQHVVRDYCVKNGIQYIEKQDIFEMVKSYCLHLYEMGKRPCVNI